MAKMKRRQFHWIDFDLKTDRPVRAWLNMLMHIWALRPRRFVFNLTIGKKSAGKVTIWCMPRLHIVRA